MPVIDREIADSRPVLLDRMSFVVRTRYVQDDRHTVLVVTAAYTLVGVHGEGVNHARRSAAHLRRFVVRQRHVHQLAQGVFLL